MTAQISDSLIIDDDEYSIAAIENEWPFDPTGLGFNPVPPHTACWRGYYSKYVLINDKLNLESLNVCFGDAEPIKWAEVDPRQGKNFKYDKMWEYRPMGYLIFYSGGLIITRDFIQEFYEHMGFHRPHCYRIVKELIFNNGNLEKETDHSEKMKRIRDSLRFAKDKQKRKAPSNEEVERYVRGAFSLSYEKKWG